MGSVDKALTADDPLGAASGLLGVGGGITGLAGWLGRDMGDAGGSGLLGGVSGLFGAAASGIDAYSDFSKGDIGKGALDSTKAVSSTLSGLASFGGFQLGSVAEMGAMEALLGGGGEGLAALGPAGAVLGAGLGGYGVGTVLAENTSVGEHSVEAIGGIDAMLTDEGERSWALTTAEAMEEDWDQGNYLSAIGSGVQLGGVATGGALLGLGGGIVDAGQAIGGGIADAASWAGDNLNPFEWDW